MAGKLRSKVYPASDSAQSFSPTVSATKLGPPSKKHKVLVRNDTLETIVLPKEPKSETPTETPTRAGFNEVFRNFLSDIAKTKSSLSINFKVSRFFDMRNKDGLGTITIPCEELKTALRVNSNGEFANEKFQQLLNKYDVSKNINFDSIASLQLIVNPREFRQLMTNFIEILREKPTVHIQKMNTHQRLYNGGPSHVFGRSDTDGMEAIDLFADNPGEPIVLPDSDNDETNSGLDINIGEPIVLPDSIGDETKSEKNPCKKGLHPNQSTDDLGESWLHKTFRNLEASLSNEQGTSVDEKKLTQFFNLYDKDGNGNLSYDEVKAMLHLESEGEFTDEEFRELLSKWDEERTESLNLNQFKRFIVSFRKSLLKKSSVRIRRFSDDGYTQTLKKTKCHILFKALRLMGTVRVKWLLMLMCVLVCAVLAPLITLAHNGMRPNDMMFGFTQGLPWVLTAWIGLGHWAVAYPRRYHPLWVGLAGSLAMACATPMMMMSMCDGSAFMLVFDMEAQGSPGFVVLGFIGIAVVTMTFWVWTIMYYGPVHHKWVFTLVAATPLALIIYKGVTHLPLNLSLVRGLGNAIMLTGILIFLVAASAGGHLCFKRPASIEGGQRAFISMAAFGLPWLTVSLVRIFANVWINDTSSLRTPLWLLWKFVAFWLINLWAKIMCYGMPTDSLAIVMMFGQIFALQFATELLFISLSPFGWQFFLILALKIALNISAKGRLLEKLNLKLDNWISRSKYNGRRRVRVLRICIKTCLLVLQVFVANAGNRVVHIIAEDGNERIKQRFITHFLYSEMSLLSSIICSIGCATLVGMEILLAHLSPGTFRHRVWTFRSDNPWLYFWGYLTVAICNILVTGIVTWLLVRDFYVLQVLSRFQARLQHTGVFKQVKDAAIKMQQLHAVLQAGRQNLTQEQHKLHAMKIVASSLDVMLREFHEAKMQLHVFERTIFRRHQIFLFFICFYLTVSIVTLLAWTQYKLFFADCGYQWNNYDHFAEVLNRVVVPTKPRCRYYPDGLNLTAANASDLYIVANLTTVLKHCTFSFNSLWR